MSDIIRDKGTKFPKLDKIQQSIRDEVFADENSIDEFLEDLQENISQFTAEIKEKNQEVVEKEKELKETSEYYQVRKDEINNSEIQNLEEKVEKKENVYEELLKEFKESLIEDFRNTKNLLSYDYNTLGHIKNKIEMYKTRNDNELEELEIQSIRNNNTQNIEPFYRMNPDYRSSTLFHHQVYVPFNELNQEVKILTIKMMPAYWRDTKIENSSLGACFVNLKLRGFDLTADISIYPDLLRAGINYGIVFYSEGSMNNGKDLVIKAYQDNDKLIITLSNPYKKVNDIKELFEEESILLNIGIQTVLSANIEIPEKQIDLFDNKVSNFKLISSGILKKGDAIYGPLNSNDNDLDFLNGKEPISDIANINLNYTRYYRPSQNQNIIDEDKKLDRTHIYRINTIESDIKFNRKYRMENPNGQAYSSSISSLNKYYDQTSELLLRTLAELQLIPGIVYKCFGWVMINTLSYEISQIKITTNNRTLDSSNYIDTSNPICGAELLFNPKWSFINSIKKNNFTSENNFGNAPFPGLVLEGTRVLKYMSNYNTSWGINKDVNTKSASVINLFNDDYNNLFDKNIRAFGTPETIPNTLQNKNLYESNNGYIGCLNGYDLSIIIPDDLILNKTPDLKAINYTYK